MSLEFVICLIIILIVIYLFFNKRDNFSNIACGDNFRNDAANNYNCPSNCPYTSCDDAGDCFCSSKKPIENTKNKKKFSLI